MRSRFHAPGVIVSLAASSFSLDRLSTDDPSELAKGGILLCQQALVPCFRFGWSSPGVCRHVVSSSDLSDLESCNCGAYFLPVESHTAMRDSDYRDFALSDETFDTTAVQTKALRNFIFRK